MKETGMVRRLDDLGRLVIPKEIRKMYKMKEGDSIEIYIKEGTICIRKYDETSSFYEQIYHMCQLLQERFKNAIFFTSEEYLQRNNLNVEEKLITKSKVHTSTRFESSKVFVDEDQHYRGYIFPVLSYGNYFGSFVMLCNERDLSEDDLQVIQLFTDLLALQQH